MSKSLTETPPPITVWIVTKRVDIIYSKEVNPALSLSFSSHELWE